MGDLETLEAVGSLSLFTNDIEDRVYKLGTFGVICSPKSVVRTRVGYFLHNPRKKLTAFSPVVTSTGLSKNKVVGAEETSKRTRANRVHGARLEIDEYSTRHILVSFRRSGVPLLVSSSKKIWKSRTSGLIVVDRNPFQLEIVGSSIPVGLPHIRA